MRECFPPTLGYSEALAVLMEACKVAEPGHAAFEARIRHLQRLGVPAGSAGTRPGRGGYDLKELAALASAVRLMDAFMVPTRAARYVTERWSILAPWLWEGARAAMPSDYLRRRPPRSGSFAVFSGNGLADLGQKRPHEDLYAGPLGDVTIVGEGAALIEVLTASGGAAIVLDSAAYMAIIVARLQERTLATPQELATQLDLLRFADGIGHGRHV